MNEFIGGILGGVLLLLGIAAVSLIWGAVFFVVWNYGLATSTSLQPVGYVSALVVGFGISSWLAVTNQ